MTPAKWKSGSIGQAGLPNGVDTSRPPVANGSILTQALSRYDWSQLTLIPGILKRGSPGQGMHRSFHG
jgi:hypothetical protein